MELDLLAAYCRKLHMPLSVVLGVVSCEIW